MHFPLFSSTIPEDLDGSRCSNLSTSTSTVLRDASSVRSLVGGCLVNFWPVSVRGVTKRCCLSWLTNSAPRKWAQMRRKGVGGLRGLRQWVLYSCVQCTWSLNKLWRSMYLYKSSSSTQGPRYCTMCCSHVWRKFPTPCFSKYCIVYKYTPHYQLFVCIKTGESCRE